MAKQKEIPPSARLDLSLLNSDDLFLFNEGTHNRIYEKLGAHPSTMDGHAGTFFGVWAPSARQVTVIGDFNGWNPIAHPMHSRGSSGVWECFIPGVGKG